MEVETIPFDKLQVHHFCVSVVVVSYVQSIFPVYPTLDISGIV